MRDLLPRLLARAPVSVHTKLRTAFLVVVVLLLVAAGVGLRALSESNRRIEDLVHLERKTATYLQLQHDTTRQLYGVATVLSAPEERALNTILRQMNQFGYEVERLQFVEKEEVQLLGRVREDYREFAAAVIRVTELIRQGKAEEGRALQRALAVPVANRLERLTNELVNKARADMVSGIKSSRTAYERAQSAVMAFAAVSVALALLLGYAISRSIVSPLNQMEDRMEQIAAGDFSKRLETHNRDELGTLVSHLNQMSDELGRAYAQLQTARDSAEQASRDKSRFLAAASHDLRQPLHGLNLWVGNLRVALGRGDMDAARRAADAIEASGQSLSDSFNAILDLTNLDNKGPAPLIAGVSLNELIERLFAEYQPAAREKGIELRLRLPRGGRKYLSSDSALLKRVAGNLLSNAVKYTHKGGVLLGAVAFRDCVRIDVADTGIGIPAVHFDDVFKEFFQIGNRARDRRKGLGLGLFIVRRSLALLPGHRLQFASREGRGSRFSVTVPRSARPQAAPAAMPVPSQPDRLRGAYVAVVEDEPAVLDGLTELLANWGCLVAGGLSGTHLVEVLNENERLPDLIIADLRLAGGETGPDVVRLLDRSLSLRVPVLITTGDPVAAVALDDLGVPLRLMHKPIIATALREALEYMLPARRLIREA